MPATVIFFISLGGISVLLGLKIFELNRGVKPFSAYRYKIDLVLRKKSELLFSYLKYFNRQTLKLLLIFILSEIKVFILYLAGKIKNTKIGSMVRGKYLPGSSPNGTNSEFLKRMSSFKDKKRSLEDTIKK